MAMIKALERETKRAQKEEWGRNKFRGALWGSNSELKLQRAERDQSRVKGMILEDKLKASQRSKRESLHLNNWAASFGFVLCN